MKTEASVRWAALLTSCAAAFLTPFLASAVNVALPSMAREFSLDAIALTWIPTAYSLAAVVFLLPFGRLADIRGRKAIFLLGLLVDAAGSILMCTVSYSAAALIAFRVVQGIGGAMMFGTSVAILTSVFPANERGKVLGINVAVVYTGLTVGPFLGGLLTEHFGWRSVFVVSAAIAVVAAGLVVALLRGEWADAEGEHFDLAGALLYGPALVALMYGLSRLPAAVGVASVVGGLAGLALFVFWETRQSLPLIEVNLFRQDRVFAYSNLAALINYSSAAGSGFLLSLYLQYVKGFSPERAGTVLLTAPLVQAIFSPLAGRLSDRLEPRLVASVGMALTAVSLGLLNLLGPTTGLPQIIACLMLFGLGFALFSSPNTNAVMSSVDRKVYGAASGVLGTMRLTGQMLSMGIVMLVLTAHLGRVHITATTLPAFMSAGRTAFTLFAVLCSGGVLASLARGRVH